MPREVEVARSVQRYGAQAILGRELGVREVRRFALAENVERVCRKWQDRSAASWFQEHPADMELFNWALKAYKHG